MAPGVRILGPLPSLPPRYLFPEMLTLTWRVPCRRFTGRSEGSRVGQEERWIMICCKGSSRFYWELWIRGCPSCLSQVVSRGPWLSHCTGWLLHTDHLWERDRNPTQRHAFLRRQLLKGSYCKPLAGNTNSLKTLKTNAFMKKEKSGPYIIESTTATIWVRHLASLVLIIP